MSSTPNYDSGDESPVPEASYVAIANTYEPFGPTSVLWFEILVDGRKGWIPDGNATPITAKSTACP
jgi:hypothetical protein